jgi:hypothetical protein
MAPGDAVTIAAAEPQRAAFEQVAAPFRGRAASRPSPAAAAPDALHAPRREERNADPPAARIAAG